MRDENGLIEHRLIEHDYSYSCYYRKIHCLTSEFHVKFQLKNRYRTNREALLQPWSL